MLSEWMQSSDKVFRKLLKESGNKTNVRFFYICLSSDYTIIFVTVTSLFEMVISRVADEVVLMARIVIIQGIEFWVSNPETLAMSVLRVDASPLAGEPFMGQLCRILQNAHDSFASFTSDSREPIRLSVRSRNTSLTASYSPGGAWCR